MPAEENGGSSFGPSGHARVVAAARRYLPPPLFLAQSHSCRPSEPVSAAATGTRTRLPRENRHLDRAHIFPRRMYRSRHVGVPAACRPAHRRGRHLQARLASLAAAAASRPPAAAAGTAHRGCPPPRADLHHGVAPVLVAGAHPCSSLRPHCGMRARRTAAPQSGRRRRPFRGAQQLPRHVCSRSVPGSCRSGDGSGCSVSLRGSLGEMG